ncbi:tyrosine-type recombinase/integrase [Shimia sagamensis]|uniref:tyrosine-type recombinase/integrase n=1 Tax=Shimia sagamensis TaxID=1566352 RepID=UPI0024B7F040|nr:integrase arm-type DNA-binding domain-containing protein [Shimia sagamensis]
MSNLTDAKIRALKPREKSFKVSDFDGLYVLVAKSGSKLWRFKYRIHGKEKLLAFGRYPEIGLKQARAMRDAAREAVAQGLDPSELRKESAWLEQEAQGLTFAAIAKEVLEKKVKEGKAPATLSKTEWLHGLLCADLGGRPIGKITPREVLVPLKRQESRGKFETALRMRAAASAVFRYAIAVGHLDNDPTYALKAALVRPQVKHRSAITDPAKVGGLLRAIDGYEGDPLTRIALSLLAYTALRPGEVRFAEWNHINLSAAVWTVPEKLAKTRREHTIPLSKQALDLLVELQAYTAGRTELLYSSRSKSRVMSENTLNAALRTMGYSGNRMTSHGFRSTFSTLANESGMWHPDAVERALAHVESNEVRKAYARGAHWEERVRMAQWWGNYLDELKAPGA